MRFNLRIEKRDEGRCFNRRYLILGTTLGYVLKLGNCYNVTSLTRNIISISVFNPMRIKPLYSRTLSVLLYKDDTEINTLDVNNRIYILNINKSQTYKMTNK